MLSKKILSLLLMITLILTSLSSLTAAAKPEKGKQQSSSITKVSFYSQALKKEMKFNIYLPPGYSKSRSYPVLYMLHKYAENEDHWFNKLGLGTKSDELIAKGKIQPMIIVTPNHDNSFGINSAEVSKVWLDQPNVPSAMYEGRYEDYLARDLVTYVDKHYSTRATREYRYIGGASMGGYAALHIAFRNPELFSKVGGHSPAVWTDDMWDVIRDWMYPAVDDRIKRDPVLLATIRPYNTLSIRIDAGGLDEYLKGTNALYDNLVKTGTKSATLHITPDGKHDEAYWSSQVESYLLFYGGKS